MTGLRAGDAPLLAVENLSVKIGPAGTKVVDGLSFDLSKGGMLALVGESGSGKTMAARAILGLLPPALSIAPGSSIRLDGSELTSLSPQAMQKVRGLRIGMVFQEPMVSLNPSMTVGDQMAEGLLLHHRNLGRNEIRDHCVAMLKRIRIDDPERCLAAYPHEFSGGMRQRIMLASVMLLKPQLLIADEPTTALDTLIQRDVLDLMAELTRENGTGVVLISHDLGMVSHYVRDVIVMYKGKAVETGLAREVLHAPKHDYTKRLVDALPRRKDGASQKAVVRTPLLELKDIVVDYPGHQRLFGTSPGKRAVSGVALSVSQGEILALVGASGSGKTTLGRTIIGLVKPSGGTIRFHGKELAGSINAATRTQSRDMQIIFQDPYSSLDPRQRVGSIVGEPLKLDASTDRKTRNERVAEVFTQVGLPLEFIQRYPHQLSGGQRQRVAIARAIVSRPAFVVADEPVSALDMTVQKQILELLRGLQERYGFACLFVSHDLGAVEQVADRVAVMENGRIVEQGSRDDIFDRPQHPYTKRLLAAAMLLDRTFAGSE
ncbi:ABC transporter ATP-binding protein [Mesorhizobium sp. 8]|uniref:ABC transporter ATP-binding protein n=1 Tax=Mesorhizobium sp. 8 TaxID=2584466 RepID=UPI00111FB768|nr:ABC transporter ATP-binding protein [Mesorhizobium sp. 8]QDC00726.1 ABC transporter ATP-binding protein [Mesorhizobium sp. 8]